MRKAGLIVLVWVLLSVLAGCSAEDAREEETAPVIIRVLAGQSTSDAGIEDMIDEWMQENYPGIKMEWECVDWGDGFNSKLQGHFASGDVPDIIIGKAQDVQTYASTGNLGKIPAKCSRKIEDEALRTVTVEGEVYGIPYNAWYQGVIYNKSIFRSLGIEPPQTESELDAVVGRLEEEGIVPFAAHFQESWKIANMTMQYMMNDIFADIPDWGERFRKGIESFSGNEKMVYCMKNNEKILEHSWDDALQIDQFESDSRFTQGEAAMYLTGSWSMQFASQYGDNLEFGIFPYPSLNGEAKLLRETNLTFMKSADSENGKLIDEILYRILEDEKLAQEILSFTQSASVVKGIRPVYESKIQKDIERYEEQERVVDVSAGNSQLTWSFQDALGAEQLLWLKKEKSLDEVLLFADMNREFSSY